MIANVLLIPEIYDCHTSSFSPILLSDRKNNSFDGSFSTLMDFLIDTIFVVFGDMMLQQTTYNRNKQTMFYYLLLITIFVLSSSMTYRLT
jgi:hypothetical protein